MSRTITAIVGLAGTGKSHYLRKIIVEYINKLYPSSIRYIVFSKDLKEEIVANNSQISDQITTLHSLCYSCLRDVGRLPVELSSEDEKIKSRGFKRLISELVKLSDQDIRRSLSGLKLLIVDEYNDFQKSYIKVVRRIVNVMDCNLILAGDGFQMIYHFLNTKGIVKLEDNFTNIERDFSILNVERIVLRKNYRSNPAILQLINGFLEMNYSMASDSPI